MNRKTVDFIEQQEGVVLGIYLDSRGLPTGGCGHLLSASERAKYRVRQKITQEECDAWFESDYKIVETNLKGLVKVPLTENQTTALISLIFNIGVHGFSGSSVLRKINQGDFASAASHFLDWRKETKHGKLVESVGLLNRRKREKVLFETK